MYRDRINSNFLTGTNSYVPGMQYAGAMVHGEPTEFILGSPAAESANVYGAAVAANAAAGTIVNANVTVDAVYGRNVRLAISGNPGNAFAVDVFGFDYLGQPMTERFTGANGVTAILYGRKCFKRIIGTKIATPSTNAVTFNLGSGSRLGLPYKGSIEYAKETAIQVAVQQRDIELSVSRAAALAVSGGSVFLRAPCSGFIKNVFGYSYGAGSTNNPVLTVRLGGVAITGLTATIVDNTTAFVSGVPTTPGYSANNRVKAGDLIEIVGTASASAGADTVGVTITPTQFSLPDLTDPQTNVTGEPRGSYEPNKVLDGTEIRVALNGDNEVNAAGNGGLHGLRHAAI